MKPLYIRFSMNQFSNLDDFNYFIKRLLSDFFYINPKLNENERIRLQLIFVAPTYCDCIILQYPVNYRKPFMNQIGMSLIQNEIDSVDLYIHNLTNRYIAK